MSGIAVRINTQNQKRVRTLTPVGSGTGSGGSGVYRLVDLIDVTVVNQVNNSTIVYNTASNKFEIKPLPIIFGGSF